MLDRTLAGRHSGSERRSGETTSRRHHLGCVDDRVKGPEPDKIFHVLFRLPQTWRTRRVIAPFLPLKVTRRTSAVVQDRRSKTQRARDRDRAPRRESIRPGELTGINRPPARR